VTFAGEHRRAIWRGGRRTKKYHICFAGKVNCLEEGLGNGSSVVDWGSHGGLVESWLSVGNWVNSLDDWGSNGDLGNSRGGTVNNSVESVDGVSGVGDGTDSTIGLNKGVLALNNISVTALVSRVLVSGEGIGHGVSIVVLWMRVVWLSTDGWNDSLGGVGNWSHCLGDEWSVGIGSNWSHSLGDQGGVVVGRGGVGGISWSSVGWSSIANCGWSKDSSAGAPCKGEDGDDLDHCDVFG